MKYNQLIIRKIHNHQHWDKKAKAKKDEAKEISFIRIINYGGATFYGWRNTEEYLNLFNIHWEVVITQNTGIAEKYFYILWIKSAVMES